FRADDRRVRKVVGDRGDGRIGEEVEQLDGVGVEPSGWNDVQIGGVKSGQPRYGARIEGVAHLPRGGGREPRYRVPSSRGYVARGGRIENRAYGKGPAQIIGSCGSCLPGDQILKVGEA